MTDMRFDAFLQELDTKEPVEELGGPGGSRLVPHNDLVHLHLEVKFRHARKWSKDIKKGTDGTDLLRSQARWARGQAAESGGPACTGVTVALGSLAVSQASSTDRAHLRTHAHCI